MTKNYSSPIFFEHGPVSRYEKAGCCVEHAHLHAVPINVDMFDDLTKHFESKEINNFKELPKDKPYLFFENNKKKKHVFTINTIIPSQYLRQVLAVKLGKPEKWDWRQDYGLDEIRNTIEKLEEEFK